MKKNINILGSCVSRDTFGMSENDGGFHIEKCVTNSSIFSLCYLMKFYAPKMTSPIRDTIIKDVLCLTSTRMFFTTSMNRSLTI